MVMKDYFTADKMAQFADTLSQQSAFSAGSTRVQRDRSKLPRWVMRSEGDSLMVVPVMLHLPFNIMTGEEYTVARPVPGSLRLAIAIVKNYALKVPAVAAALKKTLGSEEFAKLNLENHEVTDAEYMVFKPYRGLLVYSATVMPVRRDGAAFPRPYRVNLPYDPESEEYGDLINSTNNPLIYNLYRCEAAIVAARVKKMRADNEKMGPAARNAKELDNDIKNLWDNRCIKNPYELGTTRVLDFPTDSNYVPSETVRNAWNKDVKSLKDKECYIKSNRHVLEAFGIILGSKYDRYEDFLLVKVHVPEFDDTSKGTAAQKITRVGAGMEDSIEKSASNDKGLVDFIETYREYRDDVEAWSEKTIMRSAMEYRTINDDMLKEVFKASLDDNTRAAMAAPDVFEKYQDVIALVDEELSTTLAIDALSGTEVGDITEEIKGELRVTEDTYGYGGDTMMDNDDGSVVGDDREAFLDALTSPNDDNL